MRILAVDPGETCGIALLSVARGNVRAVSVTQGHPGAIYSEILRPAQPLDAIVMEEFRLYPWLATHQGFSTLPTVEVIGVVKYLSAQAGLSCFMQQAEIKKAARQLGVDHGWPMKDRTLGSGKGKYRGPDFDVPGPQHGRDALAHGVYWAYRHKLSPAYEG